MRRFFISVLPHKNLSILYVGWAGSCSSGSDTIPYLIKCLVGFKSTARVRECGQSPRVSQVLVCTIYWDRTSDLFHVKEALSQLS